jgi:hypothetical protein
LLWRIYGTLALLLIVCPFLRAQEHAEQPDRVPKATVLIDLSALGDESTAAVMKALLQLKLKHPEDWKSILIEQGDSVYGIINKRYACYDSDYPKTVETIASALRQQNDLTSNSIVAGKSLKMPSLPVRPNWGATGDWMQINSTVSRGTAMIGTTRLHQAMETTSLGGLADGQARTAGIRGYSFPAETKDTDLQRVQVAQNEVTASPPVHSTDAALAIVELQSTEEREAVSEAIKNASPDAQAELVASVYFGPHEETFPLHFPDRTASLNTVALPNAQPQSHQTFAPNAKYWVLDFFAQAPHEKCAHGTKVHEVAMQTLEMIGADTLKSNIMDYEIDFYSHSTEGVKLIQQYADSEFSPAIAKHMQKDAVSLTSKRHGVKEVPLLYLQAVYWKLLNDADTAVISSSFYISVDGFKYLPSGYETDNRVPLFTAVTDDNNTTVEAVMNLEPIREFYDKSARYGVALVGAFGTDDTQIGMYSKKGDGVTVIGRGNG